MTLREIARIVLRRWWLVVIVPAVTLAVLLARAFTQDYQSSFNAIVVLPGDTEIPGSSERPELMVMDDAPRLIESRAFAEAVAAELTAHGNPIDAGEVQAALSAGRYSRVLAVRAASSDPGVARAIAEAAASVLPAQINRYLVAGQTHPATVEIIDPPSEASRSRPNQWLKTVVLTLVAAAMGAGLALLSNAWMNDVPVFQPEQAAARRRD